MLTPDLDHFLNSALGAGSLLDTYIEKAEAELEKLTSSQREQLKSHLADTFYVSNCEEAAVRAILLYLLDDWVDGN